MAEKKSHNELLFVGLAVGFLGLLLFAVSQSNGADNKILNDPRHAQACQTVGPDTPYLITGYQHLQQLGEIQLPCTLTVNGQEMSVFGPADLPELYPIGSQLCCPIILSPTITPTYTAPIEANPVRKSNDPSIQPTMEPTETPFQPQSYQAPDIRFGTEIENPLDLVLAAQANTPQSVEIVWHSFAPATTSGQYRVLPLAA